MIKHSAIYQMLIAFSLCTLLTGCMQTKPAAQTTPQKQIQNPSGRSNPQKPVSTEVSKQAANKPIIKKKIVNRVQATHTKLAVTKSTPTKPAAATKQPPRPKLAHQTESATTKTAATKLVNPKKMATTQPTTLTTPTTTQPTRPATSATTQPFKQPIATSSLKQKMITSNGFDYFGLIKTIRFAFHVKSESLDITRTWLWHPLTNKITCQFVDKTGKEITFTYQRDQVKSDPKSRSHQVDQWFINDSFWLMLPIHLSWNQGVTLTDDGVAPLPIPTGGGHKVTLQYPSQGGYTPGDRYDLYLDDLNRITQWVFYRGGSTSATLTCRWDNYVKVGPLWLSMDRYTADKKFHLFFTDVAIATTDIIPQ